MTEAAARPPINDKREIFGRAMYAWANWVLAKRSILISLVIWAGVKTFEAKNS
jgi:hypothetical protein